MKGKPFYYKIISPGAWRILLVFLCFLIFTGICYYPLSLHPHQYFPYHRTASNHAVLMYYFIEYLRGTASMPFSYCNIWAYPKGGFVKVLAVPSLAMGAILCRYITPRAAFNFLFMTNLLISSLSFYLIGRKIGLKIISSLTLGLIVVFHPCLQSFILRGQIENTLLWPVGFTILAIISLLTSKNKIVPLVGCSFLPILILFSTPYYMVFFIFLYPFIFLFLLDRLEIEWGHRAVLWSLISMTIAVALLIHLIEFYRPGIDQNFNLTDLLPGTLELGLPASTRTKSVLDLVWPGGLLPKEKPYLGISFLFGLFLSLIYQILSKSKSRRRGLVILLAGTITFLLLAMGRGFGSPGIFSIPLPALIIDRIYPDFQKVTKLYRALPFMAICGGLIIASTIDQLNSKRATLVFLTLAIFIIADNFAVNFFARDIHCKIYFDELRDIDPVIQALPKRAQADLPIADLPSPYFPRTYARRPELWEAYTYLQTEHCQKLVWCEKIPKPPPSLITHLLDFSYHPGLYVKDAEKTKMLSDMLKDSGIGLVILHKQFMSEEKTYLFFSVLDSQFPRFKENEKIAVWVVQSQDPGILQKKESIEKFEVEYIDE